MIDFIYKAYFQVVEASNHPHLKSIALWFVSKAQFGSMKSSKMSHWLGHGKQVKRERFDQRIWQVTTGHRDNLLKLDKVIELTS